MVQFTFENAANLWFLLALPLLVLAHYFFLRNAKKRALRFANFRALKRITGKKLVTKNTFILSLRLLILALVILAVSGTVFWYEGESNKNDFVIAIDTSSSMTSEDIPPTRLDSAKNDAILFIDALESETKIGVLTFSGVALIQTVPITDRDRVKEIIEGLEPIQAGGTDIPGAIITATNLLLDNEKGRAIVMITDGSSTIETFLDASMQHAVAYAQEYHVTIHTIGIGTNTGPVGYLPQYYNVSAIYNEDNLVNISQATGGVYSHAQDRDELINALQAIADQSTRQNLRRDLRAPLMLAALLLIFLEWILVNTRYRMLP